MPLNSIFDNNNMEAVTSALSDRHIAPSWNINRYTKISSKTTLIATLTVIVSSLMICQSLLQNLWKPDSQLSIYSLASQNTKIEIDSFEFAVVCQEMRINGSFFNAKIGNKKLELVVCSQTVLSRQYQYLGILCYRTPKSGFNSSQPLTILPSQLVIKPFRIILQSLSKDSLVKGPKQRQFVQIQATIGQCSRYYLDLIKINLDVSLYQLFDINTKTGISSLNAFNYEDCQVETGARIVLMSSGKLQRITYNRKKLTEIIGKLIACFVLFKIAIKLVIGDINQTRLKIDLALETIEDTQLVRMMGEVGRVRLWFYSLLPECIQNQLTKKGHLIPESYCQNIINQVNMNISIDKVLKGLWQLEKSLENQCLRASLPPTPVYNFNYQLKYSNDLEEEIQQQQPVKQPKPIKKEWYTKLFVFDIAPVSVQLYSNGKEQATKACVKSIYILCFFVLLGLFLMTGIIYEPETKRQAVAEMEYLMHSSYKFENNPVKVYFQNTSTKQPIFSFNRTIEADLLSGSDITPLTLTQCQPNIFCVPTPLTLQSSNHLPSSSLRLTFSTPSAVACISVFTSSFSGAVVDSDYTASPIKLQSPSSQTTLFFDLLQDTDKSLKISAGYATVSHFFDNPPTKHTVILSLSNLVKRNISEYSSRTIFVRLADSWSFVYMIMVVILCQEIRRYMVRDTSRALLIQSLQGTREDAELREEELLDLGDLLNFLSTQKANVRRLQAPAF